MKKVYFVRHGESETNAGGVIKPENEINLTELGHKQAAFIGQRAKNIPLDIIISSTILRARQTAEYIAAATGLPVETSDLFVERRYPSGQHGKTINDPEIKAIMHVLERQFGYGETHSDEETFDEIKARTKKAFEYLQNRPEENILVVAHGIFLRMVVAYALFGENLTRQDAGNIVNVFKTKNTGISFLEYDPETNSDFPWAVRTWNDHAHLG